MVETTTQHYGWTKPEITKSPSTWGNFLNTDLDAIDSLVFANQQAIVPIGAITMFGGATAPANWLICNGASLDKTAYATLFAILQYTYGGSGQNFNLPNLNARFPFGATGGNTGSTGGTTANNFTYGIGVANLPAHAHPITDVTHNHGLNQSPHGHGFSDPGHAHGISDPGHNHGDYGHGHGVSASQDNHTHGVTTHGVTTGAGFGSFVPPSPMSSQADTSYTTGGASASGVYVSIATGYANLAASGTGIGIAGAYTGCSVAAANANVSLNASGTGLSTTQNTGSGTALSIVPPLLVLNFIIRFQ